MRYYRQEINEVMNQLETTPQGLTTETVQKRLGEYGLNELRAKPKRPLVFVFLDQFKDFMIIVLIIAAVISGVLGEISDTIVIIVIVLLNAIIGFVQKFRAEKAMEASNKMAAASALVLREGVLNAVPAAELVPGDMVRLEAGNIVPADLRLMETARLKIDEAALTGESEPVEKSTELISNENLAVGDQRNMAFKDTFVTNGRAVGIVTAAGIRTELGRIAAMLQEGEEAQTPLQVRLKKFGQKLALMVLVLCAVFFGIGVLRGESLLLMLLTAISLAVAAIPEALPAVVTISLAIGAGLIPSGRP